MIWYIVFLGITFIVGFMLGCLLNLPDRRLWARLNELERRASKLDAVMLRGDTGAHPRPLPPDWWVRNG